MAQYKLAHIDMKGNRGELHDLLNLTYSVQLRTETIFRS